MDTKLAFANPAELDMLSNDSSADAVVTVKIAVCLIMAIDWMYNVAQRRNLFPSICRGGEKCRFNCPANSTRFNEVSCFFYQGTLRKEFLTEYQQY